MATLANDRDERQHVVVYYYFILPDIHMFKPIRLESDIPRTLIVVATRVLDTHGGVFAIVVATQQLRQQHGLLLRLQPPVHPPVRWEGAASYCI